VSISNYTELKDGIADFLNRSDLTSVIPTFISLAEADINRNLRHRLMENRASATVNSRYSVLPTDFLESIRLHIEGTNHNPLELVSLYDMQKKRASTEDAAGRPAFYALTQNEIELFPTPNADFGLEMYYYAKVPALSASVTTNDILTNHPDIYLYGSLSHSAPYLQEDPRIQVWAGLYRNALEGANQESQRAKTSGSGVSMKIRAF
jgi:hypothetical protein